LSRSFEKYIESICGLEESAMQETSIKQADSFFIGLENTGDVLVKTSVDFHQTIRYSISEDKTSHRHCPRTSSLIYIKDVFLLKILNEK
jgi:hypothetical protein